MRTSKPVHTEGNARILDLVRQERTLAEIARELGISRGVVSGVIGRARDGGTLAKSKPPRAEEGCKPEVGQSVVAVRDNVLRLAPLLVVCGHIHACVGQHTRLGCSPVINAGPGEVEWEV